MNSSAMKHETETHDAKNTASITSAEAGNKAPGTVLEQKVELMEEAKGTTAEKTKGNHEEDGVRSQQSIGSKNAKETTLPGKSLETLSLEINGTDISPRAMKDLILDAIERNTSFIKGSPHDNQASQETLLEIAQDFSASEIFDIYNKRLGINASKMADRTGTLSNMIYGIADHLRDIDDRIRHLEAGQPTNTDVDDPNERSSIKQKTTHASKETGTEADDPDGRPSAMQETPDASEETSGIVDTRVIFCNSDEDLAADFKDVTNDKRWNKWVPPPSTPKPNPFLTILCQTPRGKDAGIPSIAPDRDILAIRMFSKPIALFFESLAGYPVHTDHLVRMTKPFPFLIRNMAAMENQLEKLSKYYAPSTTSKIEETVTHVNSLRAGEDKKTSSSNMNPLTPETATLEPWESVEALQHLLKLVSFVQTYLGKKRKLYEELRAGSGTQIAYEDLWMLYEKDDTLICPIRKPGQFVFSYNNNGKVDSIQSSEVLVPQLYRVITCYGGMPLLGSLTKTGNRNLSEKNTAEDGLLDLNNHEASSRRGRAKDQNQAENQDQIEHEMMRQRYSPLHIFCFMMACDNSKLLAMTEGFAVRPYERSVDITSLEIYPSRFKNAKNFDLDYLSRARRRMKIMTISHLQYNGLTLGENREDFNGTLIVDTEQAERESFVNHNQQYPSPSPQDVQRAPYDDSFFNPIMPSSTVPAMPVVQEMIGLQAPNLLFDPSWEFERNKFFEFARRLTDQLDEYNETKSAKARDNIQASLEREGLLELLQGTVKGYALRDRKWLLFDVSLLQEVNYGDGSSGWDDLILPKAHRFMVQSMVQTHTASMKNTGAQENIGIVQGKGKGCIILLHGVPGVGKTSTAECVAAYTGRPLFPITGGDIGYEPEDVEKNLQLIFTRAHRWGCVLLIDEADVFLAERDKSDVKRNGLVSVFLRILEYYSGILFLTTNRVGAFDDAFRSRIHLTLYYPKLSKKHTVKIWEMNVRRIERINENLSHEQLPIRYEEQRIINFAKANYDTLQWNGRQIQNAFQTALALARFQASSDPKKSPKIRASHFKTIAKASIRFNNYLKDVHVGDETKNAKKRQLRADEWENKLSELKTTMIVDEDTWDELSSSSESQSSSADSYDDRRDRKRKSKAKRKPRVKHAETSTEESSDDREKKRGKERDSKKKTSKSRNKNERESGEDGGKRSGKMRAKKSARQSESESSED